VDDINSPLVSYIYDDVGHPVTISEYCTLEPALSNEISGFVYKDPEQNGCISNIPLPNVLVTTTNGTETFATMSTEDGSYKVLTNEGNFTTTADGYFSGPFTIDPADHLSNFTGFNNVDNANWCVTPEGILNDLWASVWPLESARPGFGARYELTFGSNAGPTVSSGNVTVSYDITKLSFQSASVPPSSQTGGTLTFDYTDLAFFENQSIYLFFNVNFPPTTNIGDVLLFNAEINPTVDDLNPSDNSQQYKQTVVGSFDPNDIQVLEREEVAIDNVDEYMHYVIRFQNTGTAAAQNVVVTNTLDANLDWNSIQILATSHVNRTVITNGSDIEFIFENINLPDVNTDPVGSNGHIAYRIKLINSIGLGDVINNNANIFFDFNAAVETNTVQTTIVQNLSVSDQSLNDVALYPNPAKDVIYFNSKSQITKVKVYNMLGQLKLNSLNENGQNSLDVSKLNSGVYFVLLENGNEQVLTKKVLIN
jgi:uncharacterized repeat protein (TIGR01451 family)